jgi:hypothetical protein
MARRKTMNQVSGRVVLKETNVGIPDLLVELYDIFPATSTDEMFRDGVPITPGLAPVRLASGFTGPDGSIVLEYEDADFQRRSPDEKRPHLVLVVSGPEEIDSGGRKLLFLSKSVRLHAAPKEAWSVSVSTEQMLGAELSAPTAVALNVEGPEAVIERVAQNVARQTQINRAVREIAAAQVAAERELTEPLEKEIENRLLEQLTGVPDKQAERLNFIRPGGDVKAAMFQALNKTIERTINKSAPATGYLVLTREQAEKLKDASGAFRDQIPADELKPLFFGSPDDSQRPTFLLRENPADVLRPTQPPPVLVEPARPAIDAPGGNGANRGGSGLDLTALAHAGNAASTRDGNGAAPATPDEVTDFVGRLISTMTSPEEAVSFGVKPRADADAVAGEISALQLRSGPADVPAFYDFHSLQIAFDYVWQKAIDEDVVEGSKALGRQLLDLGGDPLAALKSSSNPVKALRGELRTVQNALSAASLGGAAVAGIPGTLARTKVGDDGPGGTAPPIDPRPVPPLRPTPIHDGRLPTSSTNPPLAADLGQTPVSSGNELLDQIESLLTERFAFEIFAPGSVNFGILVTYRQRWVPLTYQVGNLVKTITLTPKETRKVTTKRVVKRDRSIKEMENSLRVRKEDLDNTARDEAEIIAKAEAKTNFSLTAQGSYNLGIAKGDSTTVFGKDAATNSSDTKKAFREAVIKAAQEYRDERKLEVETKESYEEEVTEAAEITNPSGELAITDLFYELQRRYKVSEKIHRLTPVVLVAWDVPNPSRRSIDALLLTHGWIIDRVLLDDQFRKPLEYFRTRLVGEEVALTTMAQDLAAMRVVVDELKKSYTRSRQTTNTLADLLTAQIVAKADATQNQESEGFWGKAIDFFGNGDDDQSIETRRILEDAARERYERAVNQERELRAQLDSDLAALKAASDAYAKAHAEYENCLMDLGTLRLHIKENILYYMQAIWSHTFKDQIFLALHKKTAPRLTPQTETYSLTPLAQPPASVPAKAGEVAVEVTANVQLKGGLDPESEDDTATLAEIADLDTLLGFKGNYLIFPLRVSNALTDFMMTPFVDSELGLRDPDELGNFTPEEFVIHARQLIAEMREQAQRGEITEAELQAAIDQLTNQLRRLLSAPRRAEDEIVVPTGSLYIESLTAAHPDLDDFQLAHRAIDVKKVQEEVRRLGIENLRYAARILVGEREDPDIEKQIVFQGNGQNAVVPADS